MVFIGFNVAFLPMHWTGLAGMPRRVYSYPSGLGWDIPNLVTTIGAFILALGVVLLIVNVVISRMRGEIAGPNPWDAPTLEWTTSSPPPAYNFAAIPAVASRHPLWEDRTGEGVGRSSIARGLVLNHGKEMLSTTVLDADPEAIAKMPEDSFAPLVTAIVLTAGFAGALVQWWILAAICAGLLLLSMLVWLWPMPTLGQRARVTHV